MNKRIYVVVDADTDDETVRQRLVRATSPATAVNHVVRNRYSASVATQEMIVELLGRGEKVEDAGSEAQS